MPCMDNGYESDNRNYHKDKLDEVTRHLCRIMRLSDAGHSMSIIVAGSRGLRDWWKQHQEEDRMRLEREEEEKTQKALKKRALEKLTPNERKALGLK